MKTKMFVALFMLGAAVFVLSSFRFDDGRQLSLEKHSEQIVEEDWFAGPFYGEMQKYPQSGEGNKRAPAPKKDRPDLFAEWHNGIRTPPGASAPDYRFNYQVDELLKARHVRSTRELSLLKTSGALPWVERGPGNVAGRTRAILVDPRDAGFSTWYVGSVGGGVWKTSDAGQSWLNLTQSVPNLATSALAASPNFPETIYAGTGEGFGNIDQIDGSGIWKSTDSGATWAQLIGTIRNADFENIMRILVDPANPNIVLAATASGFNTSRKKFGIHRSTDGGETWTKTYSSLARVEDLIANPLNFNTQFATVNGTTIVKSLDGGQTWTESGSGLSGVGRMEIAQSGVDSNRVYISAQGGPSGGSTLYSSTDAGVTWAAHRDVSGTDPDWLGGQGWYNNAIAINPYDPNVVFVGGVNLFRLDVVPGSDTNARISGVSLVNTSDFITFVSWGGQFAGGGIDRADPFFQGKLTTGVTDAELVTVEIRFGPGKSQKAHRFINGPDFQYPYQNYVDVPFEVWDITNNRQLMASFRDDENNGVFELEDRTSDIDGSGVDREYIFVHVINYNSSSADPQIARTAGQAFKAAYAAWPEAPDGAGIVNPATLSHDGTIRINVTSFITRRVASTNITDGYSQFGGSDKGVHVDHHNITLVKTNDDTQSFRLLNGNDGGVSFSDDGGLTFSQTGDTFASGLRGYNTSQFYGVDKAPGVSRYVGGSQDNGSWVSPLNADKNSVWSSAPSGDGFEVVWNYADGDKLMQSSQFNSIFRSFDGGTTWASASNGLADQGSFAAPFFTKLAKSKQDADLIFAIGSSGIWRTDNFANYWTLTRVRRGFNGTGTFTQVKISLANPRIVWSATNMTASIPPIVSTDAGLTFSPTTAFATVTLGRVSGLETHPTEENTAYVLSSLKGKPKILRTRDLGQTWEELSGFGSNSSSSNGFPDVAVYSLLVMPFNTNRIWAGTEIGIFESLDGGATWAFANNGLEAAAVYEMLIVDDQIIVATHGRGIWTVTMPELAGYKPPVATLSPRFIKVSGGTNGLISVHLKLPSPYDSSTLLVDGLEIVNFPANASAVDTTFDLSVSIAGRDSVTLLIESRKGGKTLRNVPFRQWVGTVFPQAEHSTNKVTFGLRNDGIYGDDGLGGGAGFQFNGKPGGTLFSGGFVAATGATRISANVPSFQSSTGVPLVDFATTAGFLAPSSDADFDQILECSYREGSSVLAGSPLGITVRQVSYSRQQDDFAIVSLEITNSSPRAISGLYIGQFADWDVGRFDGNRGGFDAATDLVYEFDNTGVDPNYYGMAALSGASGAGMQTGSLSAAFLFNALSGFPVIPSANDDYRAFIGSGPFDLNPGEMITVGFAWLGGETLAQLKANAQTARGLWDTVVSVEDGSDPAVPETFALFQNYPNPFNPTTRINYSLPRQSEVTLSIFNIAGQKVRDLVQGEIKIAGNYSAEWDGTDRFGRQVASGLYFYTLRAGEFTRSAKMTLLK